MAAGSGVGQDGSILNVQFQEVVDRWNLNVSGSFSDILAVLLCMCFVPLIPVWLITADSEGWTVQLTLTSMAPYMQKYPTNFCGSYKPCGFISQTACWCKLPNPQSHQELEYAWPLSGYSSDWGWFRAESQNFSPIPNFFETGKLWIYYICSFNKLLADIALGVYFPAFILYHQYLRQEL